MALLRPCSHLASMSFIEPPAHLKKQPECHPVNFDGKMPDEVTVEDKSLMEQVKLIQELEPEEKSMIFKMIETFLTKKKFKDFFIKNITAL